MVVAMVVAMAVASTVVVMIEAARAAATTAAAMVEAREAVAMVGAMAVEATEVAMAEADNRASANAKLSPVLLEAGVGMLSRAPAAVEYIEFYACASSSEVVRALANTATTAGFVPATVGPPSRFVITTGTSTDPLLRGSAASCDLEACVVVSAQASPAPGL